jgi:hypothetical protein
LDDLDSLNYDDLHAVAKLTSSPHYTDVMNVSTAAVAMAAMAAPGDLKPGRSDGGGNCSAVVKCAIHLCVARGSQQQEY